MPFRRLLVVCLLPGCALALVPPAGSPIRERAMRHESLAISTALLRADGLDGPLAARVRSDLARLGSPASSSFVDARTGRWATLLPAHPLIPGDGVGNGLSWQSLGHAEEPDDVGSAAWRALRGFLSSRAGELLVDPAELESAPSVSVHEGGRIVQITVGRRHGGLVVRGSSLTAVINHGNLVLLGSRRWGTIEPMAPARLSERDAAAIVSGHLAPFVVRAWRKPHLEVLPVAAHADPLALPVGDGIVHRLVWSIHLDVEGDLAPWEAIVDAHTGALLAFQDTASYATRTVSGGVLPVSNDGLPPDGVEQAGYPMPYADATGASVPFSDGSGDVGCASGTVETHLAGPYVRILDTCGPISESSTGDVDLGTNPGTDCSVPAGHSAGDTRSARSGFYELNRIKEMARGWLPDNLWLSEQLTANMNIEDTCNANWNGSAINFYRSGGGCANTGEIAAVFDHEWGHGLDDNDTNREISSPGESIADIYAMLRLHTSCIGRGFRPGIACDGYGDVCLGCTGVRDIDYAQHESGEPHDIAWIFQPTVLAGGGCVGVAGTQQGPCAQETHCEGMVAAEAAYDLVARDLQAAPFGMSEDTAYEVGTRLLFLGASSVGAWYNCNPVLQSGDGCNADGGYLNLLAADDTNGNLADGTPHMTAIHAAFARHGIACGAPAPVSSGCAAAPTQAPAVSATAFDKSVRLSWSPVPGAARYWVFRTEGVHGCSFGKVRLGETTATTWLDEGVRNGIAYSYGVAAVGASDSCMGPMSACDTIAPVAGPSLAIGPAASLTMTSGDGDPFVDDCEYGQIGFSVQNSGSGALTGVRVTSAACISHPGVTVGTYLPHTIAATLPECGTAAGSLAFRASGIAMDSVLVFQVEITSDELAALGLARSRAFEIALTESDFAPMASKTFGFEEGDDGWQVVDGTFERTSAAGGANGTSYYIASSSLVNEQCDQVRSPLVRLAPTSTLALFNQFNIEPLTDAWYDRANVALIDVATGTRTVVSPSGGRTYIASGPNGACASGGHPGWAGPGPAWLESTFTPAALQAPAFAGRIVELDLTYGTDPLVSGTGFWMDEVTLTDVDVQVADAQSGTCDFTSPGEPSLLRVARSGGQLVLSWSAPAGSCQVTDYAVHQGTLASLARGAYDHEALACTTGGSTSHVVDAPVEAVYFLVSALNANAEGTLGRASSGALRPPSSPACRSFHDPSPCP